MALMLGLSGYIALFLLTALSFLHLFAYLSGLMGWEIAGEVCYEQSHQNANNYALKFPSLVAEIHLCC